MRAHSKIAQASTTLMKQSLLPMRAHSKIAQASTTLMKPNSATYGDQGRKRQRCRLTAGSHPESWQHFCHFLYGVRMLAYCPRVGSSTSEFQQALRLTFSVLLS